MAKNNSYINKQRYLFQQVENVVPSVYACVAMTLFEGGMPLEMIEDIFVKSQAKWEEHTGNLSDILIKCYNQTSICLMTQKQYDKALAEGLIDDKEGESC